MNHNDFRGRIDLIKSRSVEASLQKWEPWLGAIRPDPSEFDSIGEDPGGWLAYTERVLRELRLPSKPLLRLHLLSYVFAQRDAYGRYRFHDPVIPEFLHAEVDSFYDSISQAFWLFRGVYPFLRVAPTRLFPDFESMQYRPMPPAIWNEADVDWVLSWESHQCSPGLGYQRIRDCYGPFFMVLPHEHPLLAIARGIKRGMDDDTAVEAAIMKEEGATYLQIGERYGWSIQENEYERPSRCQTARRYVKRGRSLGETHGNPSQIDVGDPRPKP